MWLVHEFEILASSNHQTPSCVDENRNKKNDGSPTVGNAADNHDKSGYL
jgi:hypothetical protein